VGVLIVATVGGLLWSVRLAVGILLAIPQGCKLTGDGGRQLGIQRRPARFAQSTSDDARKLLIPLAFHVSFRLKGFNLPDNTAWLRKVPTF
jgi:hypothetical protein